MARFTLDPKNLPTMSKEDWARLEAMTDEQITAAAESDPDNPPLTDEELQRVQMARRVRTVRAGTGIKPAPLCRGVSDQCRAAAGSGARPYAAG